MKLGILGCGNIARSLSYTFRQMSEIECYAVASRDKQKAEAFAKETGFTKAYGSYEELVKDPGVELVYVATPHSRHFEDMKLCIENGKPVLCEKSFTKNAAETREIKRLAHECGVYAAEAIWTRYMPSRKIINDLISSGIIGRPYTLTANLSYVISHIKRILEPELAGGALLDVGVYGLNFAFMHFGTDIERIESSVKLTETGVDGQESITLHYRDGRMATLVHGIYGRSDRHGIIYGDNGYIVVDNINNPHVIKVFDQGDNELECIEVPPQISGYEYEVLEAVRMIKQGAVESESMPLDDTAFVMETMDGLRKSWGVVYPGE